MNIKKTLLIESAFSALLCVTGCGEITNPSTETHVNDGVNVYDFGTGKFRRIDIDGVDCVIGAGTYDHSFFGSCDLERKDT